MSQATPPADTDTDTIDHAAIRLMLSYVEAECLRIGATDAARHAAMAAALMPAPVQGQCARQAAAVASHDRPRSARLH